MSFEHMPFDSVLHTIRRAVKDRILYLDVAHDIKLSVTHVLSRRYTQYIKTINDACFTSGDITHNI